VSWKVYVAHHEIFGDSKVLSEGGSFRAVCGCGVTNAYRNASDAASYGIWHGNHMHEIDVLDMITAPDGLSRGRAWFGLWRSAARDIREAFSWMPATMPNREHVTELLAWSEQHLITATDAHDIEWLGWLGRWCNSVVEHSVVEQR
jgi:hypothetical protein